MGLMIGLSIGNEPSNLLVDVIRCRFITKAKVNMQFRRPAAETHRSELAKYH